MKIFLEKGISVQRPLVLKFIKITIIYCKTIYNYFKITDRPSNLMHSVILWRHLNIYQNNNDHGLSALRSLYLPELERTGRRYRPLIFFNVVLRILYLPLVCFSLVVWFNVYLQIGIIIN